jgi:hypothetical protein
MRALLRTSVLSGLFCLCACGDGTSTGNPTTEPPGNLGGGETAGGSANCKVTSATELGLDAESALGFTANDVLAFVEGTHEETLRWYPQDGFSYAPESGEHALTVQITRDGAPRFTKYTRASNGSLGEIALAGVDGEPCSDAIEIDVEVLVKTDQGALDETFPATLIVRNDKAVSIYHRFKEDKAQGSFVVTNVNLANARVVQLALSIQLTRYSMQGNFTGIVEQRLGEGPTAGVSAGSSRNPIASWGAQDCSYHGTPVPRSAAVDGVSGDDALALVNRTRNATVTFSGGAASKATLSFSALSEHACAVLDDGYASFGGAGSIYLRATLRIQSEDGRIDGTWQVGLTAKRGESGALSEVQVTFDDAQIAQPGSLVARYGIHGIDESRFDNVSANLTLKASPEATLDGELAVTGFTNTPCMPVVTMGPNGGGSSGCPGAQQTAAALARITASANP